MRYNVIKVYLVIIELDDIKAQK